MSSYNSKWLHYSRWLGFVPAGRIGGAASRQMPDSRLVTRLPIKQMGNGAPVKLSGCREGTGREKKKFCPMNGACSHNEYAGSPASPVPLAYSPPGAVGPCQRGDHAHLLATHRFSRCGIAPSENVTFICHIRRISLMSKWEESCVAAGHDAVYC